MIEVVVVVVNDEWVETPVLWAGLDDRCLAGVGEPRGLVRGLLCGLGLTLGLLLPRGLWRFLMAVVTTVDLVGDICGCTSTGVQIIN